MAATDAGRRHSSVADEGHLAALGIHQELKRNFSMLSMLGLAFAILNTWTALSASLTLALPSGGSTSILWGLITAGICNLCLAASLAEFLSAYPTAGGMSRPDGHSKLLSRSSRSAHVFAYRNVDSTLIHRQDSIIGLLSSAGSPGGQC